LDLPPKIYERYEVALTKEQLRIYQELKQQAIANLEGGGIVTGTRVITRMIRLHQLVCGYVRNDDDGAIQDVPSNRINALIDLLEDHSGKAIIWANYDYNIRSIQAKLIEKFGPDCVSCFWGGNSSTRMKEIEWWRHEPNRRFLVSTQQSGGLGHTWTEADLVIYYANNYNLEMRFQSEDRAHRAGQTKSVTYVDLVSPGTVDETIINALRKKINLATVITGDNYQEWLI
jgi:SNF2 family DNA or RNA helicase